jgi:hypothetical protein
MSDKLVPAALSSQLDVSGEEKIHAAPYATIVRPVFFIPPTPVYAARQGSELLVSYDGGFTWPTKVATGGADSSSVVLNTGGGRLTRYTPTAGRTTTDVTTFAALTGLSGSGFSSGAIRTASEWLVFAAGGIRASTNGIAYVARTSPAVPYSSSMPARLGSNILFVSTAANNSLGYSANDGATWGSITTHSGTTMHYTLLIAGTSRFLAFTGTNGTVHKSNTGASGTWSTGTSVPTVFTIRSGCRNPLTGRIVVINALGQSFFTDDDGDTWNAGSVGIGNYQDNGSRDATTIFANGRYICAAHTTTGLDVIYTSEDGDTWTLRYSIAGNSLDFIMGLGAFDA